MNITTIGIVTLIISSILIFGGIPFCINLHYKHQKEDSGYNHTFSPLQIYTIIAFVAVVVILFPINLALINEVRIWNIGKILFVSIQHTLQVFTANTDFAIVQDVISDSALINSSLGQIYGLFVSIMYVVSPALTASFLLLFFKEAVNLLHYYLHRKSDIYYFSELSEKSLTLAKDIRSKYSKKSKSDEDNSDEDAADRSKRYLILFAGVDKDDSKMSPLIAEAEKIGAICLKREINCIKLRKKKRINLQKFYFISEDEDKNIAPALDLLKNKLVNKYDDKTELYVFAYSDGSEKLMSSIETGDIKVRRVNENRNLAWQTLRTIPLFDNSKDNQSDAKQQTDENETKYLNIVVVGCGKYGTELVKAIAWLGQMPNYELSIHVFDKEKNIKEKFKCIARELVEKSEKDKQGKREYNIDFHGETDVESYDFIKKIIGLDGITSVFVTLGTDEVNIDTAIKIRTALIRTGKYKTWEPNIYPVVYSESRYVWMGQVPVNNQIETKDENSKSTQSVVQKFKRHISKYNLHFIGNITTCYSVENIEQKKLEKKALKYHLIWSGNDHKSLEEGKEIFNKIEYNRSSTMAQALYIEYLKKLEPIKKIIFDAENEMMFSEYEHRRWCAYMRAEGFVHSKDRDDLPKMHDDLKEFKKLKESEKLKDKIWKIAIDEDK